MSPKNKKELILIRKKLDSLDNKLIELIKKRTKLVDLVIKNNTYVGVLIFPGISISHNSLIISAALLNKIKFVKIKKITQNN